MIISCLLIRKMVDFWEKQPRFIRISSVRKYLKTKINRVMSQKLINSAWNNQDFCWRKGRSRGLWKQLLCWGSSTWDGRDPCTGEPPSLGVPELNCTFLALGCRVRVPWVSWEHSLGVWCWRAEQEQGADCIRGLCSHHSGRRCWEPAPAQRGGQALL